MKLKAPTPLTHAQRLKVSLPEKQGVSHEAPDDPSAVGRKHRCPNYNRSERRNLLCRWRVPSRLRCASCGRPCCRGTPCRRRGARSSRCCCRSTPQGLLASASASERHLNHSERVLISRRRSDGI